MKIPQKPENWRKILGKKPEEIIKLLENKEVSEFISKYNAQYVHWDQLRRKSAPKTVDLRHIWVLMKIMRSQNYTPLKFNGFNFIYSLLPSTHQQLYRLSKYSAGNIQIGSHSLPTENGERYIISSLMEEAIASSQLEGAATTRKVAKEMLKQKRKPKNYSEQMILNGYNTLKMIRERKNEELSEKFLLEIQKSITKDTLDNKEDEGTFRNNNDIVVGDPLDADNIYHIPPDFKLIPMLITEFCEFANNDDEFIHPIIKGIMLHFLLAYIHPFCDGNGRTARAIFYWYVISRGHWLFEYTAISKRILRSKVKYGLSYLYTETDENDLTYFIEYNLKAINESLDDMITHIKSKQIELTEANKLVSELKNINSRQASILKEFMKFPNKPVTITEIKETYKVVYQTARSDLLNLANLGYINADKIRNKFIFVFNEKNQKSIDSSIKRNKLTHEKMI